MPHTLFPTLSSSDYVLCMCNFDKRPMKNHPSQLVFHETCAWFPFVNHSITRCGVHILLRHRMGRNSDKTDNSITNSDEKVELLLAKVALESWFVAIQKVHRQKYLSDSKKDRKAWDYLLYFPIDTWLDYLEQTAEFVINEKISSNFIWA